MPQKPMLKAPGHKRRINRDVIGAIIALVVAAAILCLLIFTYEDEDSQHIKGRIKRMGYPEIAQTVVFEKTPLYGVYRASEKVWDTSTGNLVEYWKVTTLGSSFPYSNTIVSPYFPQELERTS